MEDYKYLFSGTNPIEIEQIKLALDNEGIDYRVHGEQALGVGNVELTGITGATIEVQADNLVHSRKVMEQLGYENLTGKTEAKGFSIYAIIITTLAVFLITILSYYFFSS